MCIFIFLLYGIYFHLFLIHITRDIFILLIFSKLLILWRSHPPSLYPLSLSLSLIFFFSLTQDYIKIQITGKPKIPVACTKQSMPSFLSVKNLELIQGCYVSLGVRDQTICILMLHGFHFSTRWLMDFQSLKLYF